MRVCGIVNISSLRPNILFHFSTHIFIKSQSTISMKKINLYISLGSKFLISFFLALSWAALSIWLSYSWYLDLSEVIGKPLSFLLIMGIAILPGFINSFLLASLLLDRRKPMSDLKSYPAVTVLIAAFNERDHIDLTIQALLNQKYDGDVEIIVIDDGSTDGTSEIVKTRCSNQIDLRCLTLPKNKGKANALNEGLRLSKYSLIITIDADSYLYCDALKNIVKQQMSGGSATAAVACSNGKKFTLQLAFAGTGVGIFPGYNDC